QVAPQAVAPPGIAGGGVARPVVERIAPALSGRAEIVRRYSGDDRRVTRGVELEEVAMRPDVRRVVRHVDRHVAENRDAALSGGFAQLLPLASEDELHETMEGALAAQRAPGL